MNKKLLFPLIALLAILHFSSLAQDTSITKHKGIGCGFSSEFLYSLAAPVGLLPLGITAPYLIPPAARDTCGSIILFYDDHAIALAGGPAKGFAEGAGIGNTRRSTMCAMVNYVQSTFDFSKIPSGKYLKIFIHQSSIETRVQNQISLGAPFYDSTKLKGDTVNGYAWDLINTGIDYTDSNTYHGTIELNFDSVFYEMERVSTGIEIRDLLPVKMNNGLSDPHTCQFDLYSCALHSMGHVLGFLNWKGNHSSFPTPKYKSNYSLSIMIGPNPFSVYNPLATGLLKKWETDPDTIKGSSYWVNDKQSPNNYPVDTSHKNHLGEYGSNYLSNNRISPGEINYYVMQYGMIEGWKRRRFTKGDLETFHQIIGYGYKPSFATDSAIMLANHVPWSKKMSLSFNIPLSKTSFFQDISPDYSIVNNIASSVIMNLAADTNLIDADGDTLSVYPGSLHNIVGCGNGGNNHASLSLSNSDRTITYAPRAGFFGRAQFGFNLWDGKEKGAYILYTIDVAKGTNVSYTIGDNLILNGNAEEGEEVKTIANPSINNSYYFDTYYWSSRFYQHRTDGLIYGSPTAIRNSWLECGSYPMANFGSIETSFPWGTPGDSLRYIYTGVGTPFIAKYPNTSSTIVGDRYITQNQPSIYQLTDTMRNCKRYTLEFEAFRTYTSLTPSAIPYKKSESLSMGFTHQSFLAPPYSIHLIQNYPSINIDSMKVGTWTKHKIEFTYCADTPSTLMYLNFGNRYYFKASSMLIDNVRLIELPFTSKLTVKILDSIKGNCTSRLFIKNAILECGLSYKWSKINGTLLSFDSAIDIGTNVVDTIVLELSDNCGRTAYDTISLNPCSCSVGAVFGATKDSVLPATTATSLTAGVYHLTANMSITGSPTFTNALILIEPDVKITVANNAKLTLENCHLLTCPDTNKLWKGIELASGVNSGKILVNNNTLIEDAEIAINAIRPDTNSIGKIIEVEHAIFNRNRIGINIEQYRATDTATYPFLISNSVFTSRKMNKIGTGYPTTWADAEYLKSIIDNDIYAPFHIDTFFGRARLKTGTPSIAGIKAVEIGNYIYPTYYSLTIGGGLDSTDFNLFDNICTGINVDGTNLFSFNNSFINMEAFESAISPSAPKYRGCGIYAKSVGGTPSKLQVSRNALMNGMSANRFFDCSIGVESKGYSVNKLEQSWISSSNTDSTFKASIGLDVLTSTPCQSYNVNNNDISNVSYGIKVYAADNSLTDTSKISQNVLSAVNPRLPSSASSAGQQMIQAISLDGFMARPTVLSLVKIANNDIQYCYHGIALDNMSGPKTQIINNWISNMAINPGIKAQYGIAVRNSVNALVSNNTISMSSLASSNKIRAVYAAFNTNLQVCANTSTNMDRAFDFAQVRPQVGTRWVLNTMTNSNKGFVLGSDIGHQGYTYIDGAVPMHQYLAIGNTWAGFGSTGQYETWVENSKKTDKSILFVREAIIPNELPTSNENIILGSSYPDIYDLAGSVIKKTDLTNCDGIILPTHYKPVSNGNVALKALGMLVISDSLSYDNKASQWMAQLSVFESGLQDPIQRDSFPIFDRFMYHAADSRYQWITDVQAALVDGDIATASTLLNTIPQASGRKVIDSEVVITDYSEADAVVGNYHSYYTAYLHYLQQASLDTIVLHGLADKCPAKDGGAVYLARSLFALVADTLIDYDDDDCMNNGVAQFRMVQNPSITGGGTENQSYSLYPNPNEGSFVIQDASLANVAQDDKTILIRVYNALGAMVYGMNTGFRNGKISVTMGQKPAGTYFVCIFDGKEKPTCLPFVVQ
jgi:hypothetical protein